MTSKGRAEAGNEESTVAVTAKLPCADQAIAAAGHRQLPLLANDGCYPENAAVRGESAIDMSSMALNKEGRNDMLVMNFWCSRLEAMKQETRESYLMVYGR